MGVVSELVKDVQIPRMVKIRQTFPRPRLEPEKIPQVVRELLTADNVAGAIKSGMSIAIPMGSRGIDNMALIVKSIVDVCLEAGAHPFIVPAMGSHGGATAEGQRAIVEDYGVTEDYIHCPIKSSMETKYIGDTEDGTKVFIDKYAAEADGIIVLGRIKPHTAFRGPYESGIMKMMAIGLGKQYGAKVVHSYHLTQFHWVIPMFGKAIMKHSNVIMGVGVLENPYDETAKIVCMNPQEIIDKEPIYQEESKNLMPRITIGNSDVLVIDYLGKNISGDGMDPNITGAFCIPSMKGNYEAQKIAALDLTEDSHGNANGMGMSHFITKRFYNKFIPEMTYPNCLTSTVANMAKVPPIMENDREAIQACIKTSTSIGPEGVTVVRIKDTLHLEYMYISENLLERAKKVPEITILGEPEEMKFDENGNLF